MNAWLCQRCGAVSTAGGENAKGEMELPSNWERRSMPVRGSAGARSSMPMVICGDCDQSLYVWLTEAYSQEDAELTQPPPKEKP